MGIFDSTTQTTVGTSVSRVIADSAIVPSSKTALLNAIFRNDDQLTEHALDGLVNGIGIKADSYYRYGESTYTYGLPQSTIVSASSGRTAIETILRNHYGNGITFDYVHVGAPNILHRGWEILTTVHGYDVSTNKLVNLTTSKKTDVYLKDMYVVVSDASLEERTNGSLDQWGIGAKSGKTHKRPAGNFPPTLFEVDPSIASDVIRVVYTWEETNTAALVNKKETKEETFDIEFELDTSKDYAHIKLRLGTQDVYLTYEIGKGTYPEVDAIYTPGYDGLGSYYPFVYFRYEKNSMGTSPSSDGYKTSKKLLSYLGMDYADMIEQIHSNPQIADVEQAFMSFTVPANTTTVIEQRYLFDFFKKVYEEIGAGITIGGSVGETATIERARGNSTLSPAEVAISRAMGQSVPKVSMIIQDDRFRMTLGFQTVSKQLVSGVLDTQYDSAISTRDVVYTYTTRSYDSKGKAVLTQHSLSIPVPVHMYRKRTSPDTYEEYVVYGLRMTYHIYDVFTAIGEGTNGILMIPVDRSIIADYSTADKELLLTRSMHLIFNSRVDTQIAWYQSATFQQVLFVVAIAMTVYDMGTTLATYAAGTMTAEAIAMAVALEVVKYYTIAAGIKLFVKAVGVEIAFLAAVLATMYGAYSAIKAGSIKGAPIAQDLLNLSNNLNSGITAALKDDFDALKKEYDSFNTWAKEKSELIEKANKELDQVSILSPMAIFGENPSDFYNRTIHSGNIGIIGIDSVSSFVEVALTLPKLNETIESPSYG